MELTRKQYSEMMQYLTRKEPEVVLPEDILPEDTYPTTPSFEGMEDPKLRQVELAEGGLPRVSKNALADDALQGLQTGKKKLIKNVSKYATQIAKSPLTKIALAETGIGAVLGAPMDYSSGYSPKEILLNIPTLGLGTTVKDELDMLSSLNKKDRELLLQHAAKSGTRYKNRLKGIESIIDKDTQKALDARDAFFERLEAKREKVAKEREGKDKLTGLELEDYVPE